MPKNELEMMLMKAVADAIGVKMSKPVVQARRPSRRPRAKASDQRAAA